MNTHVELLQQAANEIKSLRSQNQLMSARLDMFDKMILVFNTEPNYQRQGMAEDVVYKIEKFIVHELSEDKVAAQ